MNNQSTTFITVFILLTIALSSSVVSIINSNKKEAFSEAGEYPKSVDTPILHCDYNVKPNPGVSCLGVEDIYKN